jgi:vesicle transport protein SEC22
LSKIETIENSYSFLKFEKTITKKRKEYRDSSAKENIDRLNQELIDIKNIMHENFDMILNRDKNLSKISQMSSDLKDNSKKVIYICLIIVLKFRKDAKKLRLTMWLRQYATYIAIGLLLVFILYMKFYVF